MKKIEKRNTGLLIFSNAISKAGDLMFDFANKTFLVSLNMRSLYLVGIYQFLESIIGAFFNLFGGVIADRFKRKKIIILTDYLSGIACICLSFVTINRVLLYGIVLTNVALAILSSFSSPAYKAITKEVVEADNIAKTNSYVQTVSTIIKVLVPLFAIAMYRYIGINGILLLNGLSFISSAIIISIVKPILDEKQEKEINSVSNIVNDLKSGFKFVYSQKDIFQLLVFVSLVNFCLAGYELLLPYGNVMFPNVEGNVYGMFLIYEAAGGVIGAFLSSKVSKELSILSLTKYAGLSGVALFLTPILYIFQPNLMFISLSPFCYRVLSTIFNIQFFSYIQKTVANDFLGRVFGIIYAIAVLFSPIGTAIFSSILIPNYIYNLSIIGIGVVVLSLIFSFKLKRY